MVMSLSLECVFRCAAKMVKPVWNECHSLVKYHLIFPQFTCHANSKPNLAPALKSFVTIAAEHVWIGSICELLVCLSLDVKILCFVVSISSQCNTDHKVVSCQAFVSQGECVKIIQLRTDLYGPMIRWCAIYEQNWLLFTNNRFQSIYAAEKKQTINQTGMMWSQQHSMKENKSEINTTFGYNWNKAQKVGLIQLF